MINHSCDPTRVYIVDDDAATCKSMAWLLTSVGLSTESYVEPKVFIDNIDPSQASCILLDIRMPGLSGLEVQTELLKRNILTPIIFITSHHDVHCAVKAMKRGAFDFITKPFNERTLLDLVEKATQFDLNNRQLGDESQQLLQKFSELTAREHQILDCIAKGMLNKHIASSLHITHKTVEYHRARIMKKLGASTLADLIRAVLICQQSKPPSLN